MNFKLKKLNRNDWQVFKEIRLQMLKEEPQAYARTYEEMVNLSENEWIEKTESDNSGIIAIWVDEKLSGMIGYFLPNDFEAEIWGMFVRKEFRGKGIGKILIVEIEKEIKKIKNINRIRIEVTVTQIPAWELYKKMGFVEVGRKKDATRFNGSFFDEIILEKIILQP